MKRKTKTNRPVTLSSRYEFSQVNLIRFVGNKYANESLFVSHEDEDTLHLCRMVHGGITEDVYIRFDPKRKAAPTVKIKRETRKVATL